MAWNATPTGGGGYYISPGSGNGQGGSMMLVKLICTACLIIIFGAIGWGKIWFIWIPFLAYLAWRVLNWFMDWDYSLWALAKSAFWWVLGKE